MLAVETAPCFETSAKAKFHVTYYFVGITSGETGKVGTNSTLDENDIVNCVCARSSAEYWMVRYLPFRRQCICNNGPSLLLAHLRSEAKLSPSFAVRNVCVLCVHSAKSSFLLARRGG